MMLLQLVPGQTLKSVLFREFSEHEYFTVSSTNTGMTPLELFNFLPDVQAKAMCCEEGELKARQDHRNRILHDFVLAHKVFQWGKWAAGKK